MNRWNVPFLFCLGLFAGVAWGQNKDLNTITSVEIHGGRIEIIGTKQPSFTSFTMTDPARLVIDIAEAIFSGVPDQIPGSGAVSWIKTASYGSDASAIARVLIGFSQDVETDVASPGNKLVIKILNSSPPAVARTTADKPKDVGASASPQVATPAASDATVSEEAARKKQESKAKELAQKAEEERLAQELAQKEAAKRVELEEARRAEAEKKRQAEEESKRLAEQERIAEKQRRIEAEEAKRQAAAEQKQKAEEEQLAREKAKQDAEQTKRQAAAEQKRKAEEERLAQATARAQAESAKRKATSDQKRNREEERVAQATARVETESAKREAAADQKRNAEEERLAQASARAEAESARREAAAEQKRKSQEERLAQKKSIQEAENAARQTAADRKRQAGEERVAAAKARQEALAAEREAKLAARSGSKAAAGSSKRATMTFVGFERAASGARVYVRTTGPVHYTVQQEGDKKVVLELENTRIGTRNSRRPLDTSFFDTAVAMVSPNPAGKRTVRVEISLKEAVSFRAKQDGNEVSVEFPRASRR